MSNSEFTQVNILDQAELPPEAHWDPAKQLERLKADWEKRCLEQQKELHALEIEYKRALRSELGNENFDKYRGLRDRNREIMAILDGQAVAKIASPLELEKERLVNLEAMREIVTGTDVDGDRMSALDQQYADDVHALLDQEIGEQEDLPRAAPSELDRGDGIIKTPPFIDSESGFFFYEMGSASFEHEDDLALYAGNGYIRHSTRIDVSSASDTDRLIYFSSLVLAHLVMIPQRCDYIYIKPIFENVGSQVHHHTSAEWGIIKSYQLIFNCQARVMMTPVWHAGGLKSQQLELGRLYNQNGESGYLRLYHHNWGSGTIGAESPYELWSPGDELVPKNLVAMPGPFYPESYIGVWGGIWGTHSVVVDDYEVKTRLKYRLRLKALEVFLSG